MRCQSLRASTPLRWRLEPLAGWHLPLLRDPAFLPLHTVLQRAALLGMPERLMHWLGLAQPLAPQVIVAFAELSQTPLGLVVCQRLNRSGSCWQVVHLRTTDAEHRRELSGDLLKAAMQRTATTSWVASADTGDQVRLSVLREQGFQPLRQDQIWCWQPRRQGRGNPGPDNPVPDNGAPASASALQLQPLNKQTAGLLWHLEQVACAAQLRQILDRRVEDLLDQSQGRGWLLIDPSREVAVAGVRLIGDHAGGGVDVELTVDPLWQQLYGAATSQLLRQFWQTHAAQQTLWLRSDPFDHGRLAWLQTLEAQQRSERVLMARSLWRRQALPDLRSQANRRLEAVLAQLQPRRRPVPTPLTPR